MAPVAKDFEKIIHSARERKKNEVLADKIFSKSRRQSAPSNLKATPGGSLASRVGVKKPQKQLNPNVRRASVPAGNVDGDWTHDLHNTLNGTSRGSGSLSSRITLPGVPTAQNAAAKKKAARLAAALDRIERDDVVKQQVNIIKSSVAAGVGPNKSQKRSAVTIRGLAGPYAVMGQNFAPGTTAADVESAMTPVGGEMVSCKVVKTHPFIIVEMVFASKEGGEKVIETFHNRTADGRIIKVYPKPGGYKPDRDSPSTSNSSNSRDQIVDGTMGFSDDLMNSTKSKDKRLQYNDRNGAPANKRGRGFQKGRS